MTNKPYGSDLPKDPKEQLYEDFAKFHQGQVENHKKSLEIMQSQVDNNRKMNEVIDALAKNNKYYEYTTHKFNILKWTVIAFALCSGFFYISAFLMLAMQYYIPFVAFLIIAMYLTFLALKKGASANSLDISNIMQNPSGLRRSNNGSQKRPQEGSLQQAQKPKSTNNKGNKITGKHKG